MGTENTPHLNNGLPRGRAALVVAHPGHELRVHGWLEMARPLVCVLTDGSGRTGQSRLGFTTRLLSAASTRPGHIYGRFTDAALYAALRAHDGALFVALAEELAVWLAREQIEYVAGDAVEGYNSVHDVCRYVLNATIALAERVHGQRVANYDFLLVGPPYACAVEQRDAAVWLRLDDAALERKLAAARAYAAIAGDVQAALGEWGDEAFRIECLRPVARGVVGVAPLEDPPFYERYGAQQVAAGHYDHVLRYREHLAPVAAALTTHVEELG